MRTKTTTIYIVRHGESEANIRKLYGLVPEAKLTLRGVEQVEKLSRELSHTQFDCIFSSDLIRAKRTARILADDSNIPIKVNNGLRERSYGRLNGKTQNEIKLELKGLYEKYSEMSSKEKYYFRLVKNMETVEEVVLRYEAILREIVLKYKGKKVLIISHVIPMRGLLVHFGHVDYHQIDSSCIENTAYLKVESDGANFVVKETRGIRKVLQ